MYKQVKGIMEMSALDPEKMVAPKDIWFDADRLKEWFDSREKLRTQAQDNPYA